MVSFELSVLDGVEQTEDLVWVGDLSEPVHGLFLEEDVLDDAGSEVSEGDDVKEKDLDFESDRLLDDGLRVLGFVGDDQEVEVIFGDVIVEEGVDLALVGVALRVDGDLGHHVVGRGLGVHLRSGEHADLL